MERIDFTDDQRSDICLALSLRADDCAERAFANLEWPGTSEQAQVERISHWIREHLRAQRTLARARQLFWS